MISRPKLTIILAIASWSAVATLLAVHAHFYPLPHTVYNIYSEAAHRWWSGRDLYVRGVDFYRYSPLFAIAVTPFAFLPDQWGCPLWKIASLGFYVLALAWFLRRCGLRDLSIAEMSSFFLLVLLGSLHSLYIGQANVVMLGMLLLGLAAASDGKWNQAALWIALATLIKGYPIALALLLAVHFPRRFGPRYVVALLGGLAAPFLFQWPALVAQQYRSWFHHVRDSTEIMRERLRSIDHLLFVSGHPIDPQTFAVLGIVAGLGTLLLTLLFASQVTDHRAVLLRLFLLFAVWAMLFGPATETCTYIVMAPACAWCIIEGWRNQRGVRTAVVLTSSFLLAGILVTDAAGPTLRTFFNGHGAQPFAALLLLTYLIETAIWPEKCLPQAPGRPMVVKHAA
jgi:Glycosyltransferase family 87